MFFLQAHLLNIKVFPLEVTIVEKLTSNSKIFLNLPGIIYLIFFLTQLPPESLTLGS